MEFFLKLKHWQVFLIWIFGTIQMIFFIKYDFWFLSLGLYFGLFLIWIYSIGIVLNENHAELKKRINLWTILYLISIVPFGLKFRNMITESYDSLNPLVLFLSGLIGLVSIINIVLISAKSIKEKEIQKELNFIDFLLEFVLIFYFIIGIWILQPRLNRIVDKKKNTTNKKRVK